MMASLHARTCALTAASGWRRRQLAFALGVLATLALPPMFIFPFIFISFTGLYMLLSNAPTPRRAFWDGWWWGWGHYMTGLYWFCIALLTDVDKFAWLIPFALFGLTGVVAIYPAVASYLFKRLRVGGLSGIYLFSVVWLVVEFARGHWFSGFPWNLPAYVLNFSDATLQAASLVGAYGLSWWVVFFSTAPATFFLPGISLPRAQRFVALVALAFALVVNWGQWRLIEANKTPQSQRYVAGVLLRLVQADIAQPHKWDPRLQIQGLEEHLKLTHAPGLEKVTHIIWPETAIPYIIKPDSPLTRMLAQAIPADKYLISGTLRDEGHEATWKIWNSLVDISGGNIVGVYDKSKLVPFGEFLPFRSLLPKEWLTPVGENDFSQGDGMQTLLWPGLPPVSPLICYEVIFPERAANSEKHPAWLLSVTNDAWFGMSSGPYQHFEMARMRAVEQGLPLIRAGNTGISASIDPYGRVLAKMGLGSKGYMDVELPSKIAGNTIYNIFKNIIIPLLVVFGVLLTLRNKNQRIN